MIRSDVEKQTHSECSNMLQLPIRCALASFGFADVFLGALSWLRCKHVFALPAALSGLPLERGQSDLAVVALVERHRKKSEQGEQQHQQQQYEQDFA